MTPENSTPPEHTTHSLVGRFVWPQWWTWMLVAPMLGVLVARGAVTIAQYRSPLVLFPLLVGLGLGGLLVGLMRLGSVGHRTTIWIGTVAAVLATVAGQHYFSFRDYQTAWEAKARESLSAELFRELAPHRADDFGHFLRRQAAAGRPLFGEYRLCGAAAWASWLVDGLLVLGATALMVGWAVRAPYCPRCRGWYRTARAGSIRPAAARRLAETLGGTLGEDTASAQYRLSHCAGGCGPARLELVGENECGSRDLEAWLSPKLREQVVRVLDDEQAAET